MRKIKRFFIWWCLSMLFISCNSSNIMNGANPVKTSFKYYDVNFKKDAKSKLVLNTKYYYNFPGSDNKTNVLVFFEDGFLNKYFTTSVSAVSDKRTETGVIMGYYQISKDSIFFSTKSYYDHKETIYKGIIAEDTLLLRVKYPKKKDIKVEKYILYKE